MKCYREHPLCGRSGVGAPLAPPQWLWRAGTRVKDMYFTSPEGKQFRSKVQLNEYLESHPGSPSIKEFVWTVGEHDFRDGNLPGVEGKAMRVRKRKISDLCSLNTQVNHYQSHQAEPVPIRTKSKGAKARRSAAVHPRKRVRLADKAKRKAEIEEARQRQRDAAEGEMASKEQEAQRDKSPSSETEVPNSKRKIDWVLACNGLLDLSTVSLAKLRSLVETISDEDAAALRTTIVTQGFSSLAKYSQATLRVLFFMLRREEAPLSLDVSGLAELCSSWVCKHQRATCLLEIERIRFMVEGLDPVPRQGNNCRGECCTISDFCCRSCDCTKCKIDVGKQRSSYLRCVRCSHVCHVRCAMMGLMFMGGGLVCRACDHDVAVTFCEQRIQDAIVAPNLSELEEHLSVLAEVMGTLLRSSYTRVLRHAPNRDMVLVEQQFQLAKAQFKRDQEKLRQLLFKDSFHQAVNRLGDFQSSGGDLSGHPLAEVLQHELMASIGKAAVSEEKRDARNRAKAETDFEGWVDAMSRAEDLRTVIKDLTIKLNDLEEDTRLRKASVESSRAARQNSKHRLQSVVELALQEHMLEGSVNLDVTKPSDRMVYTRPMVEEPLTDKMDRFITLHRLLDVFDPETESC